MELLWVGAEAPSDRTEKCEEGSLFPGTWGCAGFGYRDPDSLNQPKNIIGIVQTGPSYLNYSELGFLHLHS